MSFSLFYEMMYGKQKCVPTAMSAIMCFLVRADRPSTVWPPSITALSASSKSAAPRYLQQYCHMLYQHVMASQLEIEEIFMSKIKKT